MDKQPVFFCVCSQKGGVGKSTFTILLANWLHYALGRDVLVVDCDAPQWSIVAQRERELDVLERNDRYKLMMVRLFKRTGRKIWPVVRSTPYEGLQAARAYFAAGRPRSRLRAARSAGHGRRTRYLPPARPAGSSVHSLESRQAGLGERSFLCAGRR